MSMAPVILLPLIKRLPTPFNGHAPMPCMGEQNEGGTHKLMYRTQNVTVHVNGARDPVATDQTVAYTIQRARANALHGGTE